MHPVIVNDSVFIITTTTASLLWILQRWIEIITTNLYLGLLVNSNHTRMHARTHAHPPHTHTHTRYRLILRLLFKCCIVQVVAWTVCYNVLLSATLISLQYDSWHGVTAVFCNCVTQIVFDWLQLWCCCMQNICLFLMSDIFYLYN